MRKLTKILSFAIAFVCLSLCFAGCGLDSKPTLDSIGIKGTIQTQYTINEELNLNDAKLILTYSDDTQKELDITSNMITGFDTTTVGNKTLTITYKEKTTQINYVVKNEIKVGNKMIKCGEYYQEALCNINPDGSLADPFKNYSYENTTLRIILNSNFTGTLYQNSEWDKGDAINWEVQDDKIVISGQNLEATYFSITDNGKLRTDGNGNACILCLVENQIKPKFTASINAVYAGLVPSENFYYVIRFKNDKELEIGATDDLEKTAYGNYGRGSTVVNYEVKYENGNFNCILKQDGEINTRFELKSVKDNQLILFVKSSNENESDKQFILTKVNQVSLAKDTVYYSEKEENGNVSYIVIRFKDLLCTTAEIGSTDSLEKTEYGSFGYGSQEVTCEYEQVGNNITCKLKSGNVVIAKLSNITFEGFTMEIANTTYDMNAKETL